MVRVSGLGHHLHAAAAVRNLDSAHFFCICIALTMGLISSIICWYLDGAKADLEMVRHTRSMAALPISTASRDRAACLTAATESHVAWYGISVGFRGRSPGIPPGSSYKLSSSALRPGVLENSTSKEDEEDEEEAPRASPASCCAHRGTRLEMNLAREQAASPLSVLVVWDSNRAAGTENLVCERSDV